MSNLTKCLIPLLLTITMESTFAGNLVTGAKVLEVADTYSHDATFAVKVEGGKGICVNTWLVFPESKAPSVASHNQAFSIALTALTTDKIVRIKSFDDDLCSGATTIIISK